MLRSLSLLATISFVAFSPGTTGESTSVGTSAKTGAHRHKHAKRESRDPGWLNKTWLGQDGYILLGDMGRATPARAGPQAEETISPWQAEEHRLLSLRLHLQNQPP